MAASGASVMAHGASPAAHEFRGEHVAVLFRADSRATPRPEAVPQAVVISAIVAASGARDELDAVADADPPTPTPTPTPTPGRYARPPTIRPIAMTSTSAATPTACRRGLARQAADWLAAGRCHMPASVGAPGGRRTSASHMPPSSPPTWAALSIVPPPAPKPKARLMRMSVP